MIVEAGIGVVGLQVRMPKIASDHQKGSPGGSVVKNLPAVQETQLGSQGQNDLLE